METCRGAIEERRSNCASDADATSEGRSSSVGSDKRGWQMVPIWEKSESSGQTRAEERAQRSDGELLRRFQNAAQPTPLSPAARTENGIRTDEQRGSGKNKHPTELQALRRAQEENP